MNTVIIPAILMNINYHTVALLSKLRGLPHAVGKHERYRVTFCVYGVTYSIRTWILNVILMNNHVFLESMSSFYDARFAL